MLNLAGQCLVTGHYHKPVHIDVILQEWIEEREKKNQAKQV